MSTQTAPPTTRRLANAEAANRLLTIHGWIKDHEEILPPGWDLDLRMYRPDPDSAALAWFEGSGAPIDILADLVEQFGEPTYRRNVTGCSCSYARWPGEGIRPELVVYDLPLIEAVTA